MCRRLHQLGKSRLLFSARLFTNLSRDYLPICRATIYQFVARLFTNLSRDYLPISRAQGCARSWSKRFRSDQIIFVQIRSFLFRSDHMIWSNQARVSDQITRVNLQIRSDQIIWSDLIRYDFQIRSYDLIWRKSQFQIRSSGKSSDQIKIRSRDQENHQIRSRSDHMIWSEARMSSRSDHQGYSLDQIRSDHFGLIWSIK